MIIVCENSLNIKQWKKKIIEIIKIVFENIKTIIKIKLLRHRMQKTFSFN